MRVLRSERIVAHATARGVLREVADVAACVCYHLNPSRRPLLECCSLVFMIAFPHAPLSTSNAPCPYVKRPVPGQGSARFAPTLCQIRTGATGAWWCRALLPSSVTNWSKST